MYLMRRIAKALFPDKKDIKGKPSIYYVTIIGSLLPKIHTNRIKQISVEAPSPNYASYMIRNIIYYFFNPPS